MDLTTIAADIQRHAGVDPATATRLATWLAPHLTQLERLARTAEIAEAFIAVQGLTDRYRHARSLTWQ